MTKINIRGFTQWFLRKAERYSLLLLLAAFVGIHLLILSIYVNHDRSLSTREMRTNANDAMKQLILYASKQTTPEELKQLLTKVTDATLRVGNDQVSIDVDLNKFSKSDASWLNYRQSSSNTAFYIIVILIVLLEAGIFSFIIFYAWSVYRFTGPLKTFKASAERLGIDLKTAPVTEQHGPAVVKETASAINEMQARILDLVNTRTRMLASISHDLRTPITRLKLRAEFIPDPEQSEKIMKDLTEMEDMITEILDFARSDKAQKQKVKFDLNALIFSVCDDYIDRGAPVHVEGYERAFPFLGHPLSLKRTIINLIENAIKYAGQVWIKTEKQEDHLVIYVEDNGKGLPETDIHQVFKAFYRSAYSTSDGRAGVGLGLTIAYEVVNEHGGTLTIENREEGGLRVIIILPMWHP